MFDNGQITSNVQAFQPCSRWLTLAHVGADPAPLEKRQDDGCHAGCDRGRIVSCVHGCDPARFAYSQPEEASPNLFMKPPGLAVQAVLRLARAPTSGESLGNGDIEQEGEIRA